MTPLKKITKYRNRRVYVDGQTFDSKKECDRWRYLCKAQQAGEIKNLKRQGKFKFNVFGHHICDFVADFVYERNRAQVVEDVKSPATRKNRAYRIKAKLMRAVFGVEILEV